MLRGADLVECRNGATCRDGSSLAAVNRVTLGEGVGAGDGHPLWVQVPRPVQFKRGPQ